MPPGDRSTLPRGFPRRLFPERSSEWNECRQFPRLPSAHHLDQSAKRASEPEPKSPTSSKRRSVFPAQTPFSIGWVGPSRGRMWTPTDDPPVRRPIRPHAGVMGEKPRCARTRVLSAKRLRHETNRGSALVRFDEAVFARVTRCVGSKMYSRNDDADTRRAGGCPEEVAWKSGTQSDLVERFVPP